jgi:hypothetical protein
MGIFGSPKPPKPDPAVAAAQARQEQRAEAQTLQESQSLAARQNVRRTGGFRLLFSQARQDAMAAAPTKTTLGG